MVYAFMIHCALLKSVCSTFSTCGRITGTLEISRPNMSAARQMATRATAFLRAMGFTGGTGKAIVGAPEA
ncbi:hypothetical protein DYGSA30_09190 [Dyella sp. GSA-30]|nr:hypothetical protein DYGSA30_09190 [Dyella sp. GSA-30]